MIQLYQPDSFLWGFLRLGYICIANICRISFETIWEVTIAQSHVGKLSGAWGNHTRIPFKRRLPTAPPLFPWYPHGLVPSSKFSFALWFSSVMSTGGDTVCICGGWLFLFSLRLLPFPLLIRFLFLSVSLLLCCLSHRRLCCCIIVGVVLSIVSLIGVSHPLWCVSYIGVSHQSLCSCITMSGLCGVSVWWCSHTYMYLCGYYLLYDVLSSLYVLW